MDRVFFWRQFDVHDWAAARATCIGMMWGLLLSLSWVPQVPLSWWVLFGSVMLLLEVVTISSRRAQAAVEVRRAHTESGEVIISGDGSWDWVQ